MVYQPKPPTVTLKNSRMMT